ncbi:hypothetical protein MBANPS3_010453 [Mucor bainieri]
MKLRDRTKLHLDHKKQEDGKPAVTVVKLATRIDTDTDTDTDFVDLTIKQEDRKRQPTLIQPHGEFGAKGYYYRCDRCDMKMADLKSLLQHRKSTHMDRRGRNKKIKHINAEPDIHDSNYYCKSCEKSYGDSPRYRHHLRYVHYMALKPISSWKAPRKDIFPDPDDPNLYCRACERSYSLKTTYKRHCRFAHEMKHAQFTNTSSTSSVLVDSYCQACDKRLANMSSYHQHLFAVHNVDWRTTRRNRNDITPDVNDPNLHCQSCEKTFANKYSFKAHLMQLHSIFQSAPRKKSSLEPDVDDPNSYCCACQKTYPSKSGYRTHLRMVHHMTLPSLRDSSNRTDLPDPYDPDRHCSVCKKTYASNSDYRQHCKSVHFMTLNHASIVNPDATIDIKHRDFYCAQCEKSLASKTEFEKHLRRIHDI